MKLICFQGITVLCWKPAFCFNVVVILVCLVVVVVATAVVAAVHVIKWACLLVKISLSNSES